MRKIVFNILSWLIKKICNHPTYLYMNSSHHRKTKFCPDCGKVLNERKK